MFSGNTDDNFRNLSEKLQRPITQNISRAEFKEFYTEFVKNYLENLETQNCDLIIRRLSNGTKYFEIKIDIPLFRGFHPNEAGDLIRDVLNDLFGKENIDKTCRFTYYFNERVYVTFYPNGFD